MPARLLYGLPAASQDLTGKTFGRWKVLRFVHRKLYGKDTGHNYWECQCSCADATVKIVSGPSLKSGGSLSCGCLCRERTAEANTTHGYCKDKADGVHPIYSAWRNMMNRCYNEKVQSYHLYGGRGIKVDELWHTFSNFEADMAPTWHGGLDAAGNHLSVDRIDTNSNYGPGLCKWSTSEEQGNNQRKNVYLELNGKRQTAARWARELNIPPQIIICRKQKLGWSDVDCLTTPVQKKGSGPKKK